MRPSPLLLLAALACAAGPTATLHADDLAAVLKRGELRVAAVVSDPKDEFMTAQPGVGLERELLESFAALHRLKLTVVPAPGWDRLVPMVLEGRADVAAGRITVTEARRQKVDFTSEVFPTRSVVVTRKPHAPVATAAALRNERVGTVRGTSMAETIAAAGVPPAAVDDSIASGALPQALRSGRVGAVVLGVENAISEQRKDPELQLGTFLGPPGSLAWAVARKDGSLREALDAYVASMRRSPTWNRLVVKYFGEDAPEILKRARTD